MAKVQLPSRLNAPEVPLIMRRHFSLLVSGCSLVALIVLVLLWVRSGDSIWLH